MMILYMFQRLGYIWAEDKEHCEEYGRMLNADPSKVSIRAKKRGLPQVCKAHSIIHDRIYFFIEHCYFF